MIIVPNTTAQTSNLYKSKNLWICVSTIAFELTTVTMSHWQYRFSLSLCPFSSCSTTPNR